MQYESILSKIDPNITVKEIPLKYGLKGIYKNGKIIIDATLNNTEKACILAEELGHHYTSCGNIIDQTQIENRKQELRAREWAHNRLISLDKIIEARKQGIRNKYELATFLGVTEYFLDEALKRYAEKYGVYTEYKEYIVYFEPLMVFSKI